MQPRLWTRKKRKSEPKVEAGYRQTRTLDNLLLSKEQFEEKSLEGMADKF